MNGSPELYPLTQAAYRAGISRERLLRAVLAGRVAGRQVLGGRWVVEVESLDRWITERQASEPREPAPAA
jgi:hypothetical protein